MGDPSKYGVVVFQENGKIDKFVEKPKDFVSNKINAGLYIFTHKIFDRIEVRVFELNPSYVFLQSESNILSERCVFFLM